MMAFLTNFVGSLAGFLLGVLTVRLALRGIAFRNRPPEVRSILDPVDWTPIARLSPANAEIVRETRAAMQRLLEQSECPGMMMRGMTLAITDQYEGVDLERGMRSTIRGVRNAFAEKRAANVRQ